MRIKDEDDAREYIFSVSNWKRACEMLQLFNCLRSYYIYYTSEIVLSIYKEEKKENMQKIEIRKYTKIHR